MESPVWAETSTSLRVREGIPALACPVDFAPRRFDRAKLIATLVRQAGPTTALTRLHITTEADSELNNILARYLPDFEPWVMSAPDASAFWETILAPARPRLVVVASTADPTFGWELMRLRRSVRELDPALPERLATALHVVAERLRICRGGAFVIEETPGRLVKHDPLPVVIKHLLKLAESVRSNAHGLLDAHERIFKSTWGVASIITGPAADGWGESLHLVGRAGRLRALDRTELAPLIGAAPRASDELWISAPSAEFALYLATLATEILAIPPSRTVIISLAGYHPILNAAAFLMASGAGPRTYLGCDEGLRAHSCTVAAGE